MDIYNAILKAADHIEKEPHLYNFYCNRVPDCGTPGCMLGWIGHFMGLTGSVYNDVAPVVGLSRRCLVTFDMGAQYNELPMESVEDAVRVMRRFALRFKPSVTGIPASVREIFQPRETAILKTKVGANVTHGAGALSDEDEHRGNP